MYVAIAGNIGSGKTTLTRLLAKRYGWTPHYEPAVENPYIEDYYRDIPRWAFPMEVFYLRHRFADLLRISQSTQIIIQDRTIFEGAYVFATNNYLQGNLSERDYQTYMGLFESMMEVAQQPMLLIYLRASVPHLVGNIQRRGRGFEQNIPLTYLQGLNELYEQFINERYTGPLLTIEADTTDFEHRPADFAHIADLIDARINPLFP